MTENINVKESRGVSPAALLVAGAFFMEFLDGTVIATALPDMARSFGVEAVELNIGISAYLITLAVLTTLGRLGELRGHLRGALNLGLTTEELVEALIQVSAYAGLPATVAALDAAAEVLAPEG